MSRKIPAHLVIALAASLGAASGLIVEAWAYGPLQSFRTYVCVSFVVSAASAWVLSK
jgi:hypothetical protein